MEKIIALLKDVLVSFVDHTDDVNLRVNERAEDGGTLYEITIDVHENDIGKCIGKGGETVEALRKIFGLVGFKHFDKPIYIRVKTSVRYNK